MAQPIKHFSLQWHSFITTNFFRSSFSIPRHLGRTGTITDTEKETPAGNKPSEAESRGLLGRLPRLEAFTTAAAPSSPHKVANNIKGFFANKLENVIPDTGKQNVSILSRRRASKGRFTINEVVSASLIIKNRKGNSKFQLV